MLLNKISSIAALIFSLVNLLVEGAELCCRDNTVDAENNIAAWWQNEQNVVFTHDELAINHAPGKCAYYGRGVKLEWSLGYCFDPNKILNTIPKPGVKVTSEEQERYMQLIRNIKRRRGIESQLMHTKEQLRLLIAEMYRNGKDRLVL